MRRSSCFLAFAWIAACGPPSGRPHRVVVHGSEATYEAALGAAREWRETCGADLSVEREGPDLPVLEVEEIPDDPTAKGDTIEVDGQPVRVLIVPYAHEQATLAHEFGHVLGLGHLPDGLMAADAEHAGADDPHVTLRECDALSAVGYR